MIDVETLGQHEDAHILSIAAVRFDPYAWVQPDMLPTVEGLSRLAFYSLAHPHQPGRKVEADTSLWWMNQSDEARRELIDLEHHGQLLPDVLSDLKRYAAGCSEIWAHGSTFDLPILMHAYQQAGIKPAWSYKDVRDTRTIFGLMSTKTQQECWPENPRKHDPRWDAAAQAVAVTRAYAALGLSKVHV